MKHNIKRIISNYYSYLRTMNSEGLKEYTLEELKPLMQAINIKLQQEARELPIYDILNMGIPVFIKTGELEYNDAYNKNLCGYWWPLHNRITKELKVYFMNRNTHDIHHDSDSSEMHHDEKNFIVVLPRQPVVKLNFDFLDPAFEGIPF